MENVFVLVVAVVLMRRYAEATDLKILPEHVALTLGAICALLGVSMILNLDPAIMVVSAFLLALFFPKFRAGVLLAVGVLEDQRMRGDFEFSEVAPEPTTSYGVSSSDYARDFSLAQATGVNSGTPGSLAGSLCHVGSDTFKAPGDN